MNTLDMRVIVLSNNLSVRIAFCLKVHLLLFDWVDDD